MKLFALFFLAMLPFVGMTQQVRFSPNVGYVIGEFKHDKKSMILSDINLGYEFSSHKKYYLLLSAGYGKMSYHSIDELSHPAFITRRFAQLSANIRKYYFLNKGSDLFIDLGIVEAYTYSIKNESFLPQKLVTQKNNLGYNNSLFFAMGFKKAFSRTSYFDISITPSTDLFENYRDNEAWIRTKKNLVGFSLYKTITK